ncbi:putative ferric-chelate reductase 1 [Pogona vitticeps]
MKILPCLFLLWEVFSATVLCYPNGEISGSCTSMLPGHRDAVSQTTPPPYAIFVSSTSFTPGDEVIVSLVGVNETSFRGFLLQARAVGGETAVGSFRILTPNVRGLACSSLQNSSLSHTNREDKQNVTAIWIAPSGIGHVVFRATVVQTFSIFWTQIESPVLVSTTSPISSVSPSFTQITSSSATISTEAGCGTWKFCFSNPPGCSPQDPNCYFMSSTALEGSGFKFEMSGLSAGYVAIGFSDDTIMGNDDIYICGRNTADRIEVQHAFSTGRTTPISKPLGEVEVLATSFNKGITSCSFISRNAISTQSRDVGSLYYIFLAFGPSSAGQIQMHPRIPFITNQKVNISSFEQAQGGARSTPLIIKAHGALMLIAWMTTGSIGMIFAKFLKRSIKTTLLGKETWFQVHFLMMMLTVAATGVAFILIFVAVKGWSSGAGAHAIIGCIVTILSFLQMMIAFFRPSLQNNWRFVFNWFHMLNALVIKVLAVAAIFLGLQMLSNSSGHWMVKTMGGFVGWEALMVILMVVNQWFKKKEIYEDPQAKVKSEILLLHICVCGNLAFLIALLVGIGRS